MAAPKRFQLGMNGSLMQGAAEAALSALSVIGKVKDLTLTLEAGEADITTRDNDGWEAIAATLRKCGAEFEVLYNPNDQGVQALKTAFLASTTLRMAVLSAAIATEGASGPVGDFVVSNFGRNEQLVEGMMVPVTINLNAWSQWLEPPVTYDQTATVAAAAADATVVGTMIAALGADMTDETIVYSIDSQTVAGVFAIDSADGEVTVLLNTNLGAAGTVHVVTCKLAYATSGLPFALANYTITVTS
jgi:hypothetical protein